MVEWKQTDAFLKSWWAWRNSLAADQRWMADAMAWSATHGAEVQGYEAADWSWAKMGAWLNEQKSGDWQQWSQSWKSDAPWAQ